MYKLSDEVWFIETQYIKDNRIEMADSDGVVWHRYQTPKGYSQEIKSGVVRGIEQRITQGDFDGSTSEHDYVNYSVYCGERFHILYDAQKVFNSREDAENYLQSSKNEL